MRMLFSNRVKFIVLLLLVVVIACSGGAYFFFAHAPAPAAPVAATYKTAAETTNVYVRFDMEAYDSIVKNYWQTPSDADMSNLFLVSTQKALALMGMSTASTSLPTDDRAGTAAMLESAFAQATTTDAKKNLATGILQVALYNLPPAGRDQLLSQTAQVALQQEVNNVNPSKDLYSDLGLSTGASSSAVDAAYQKQAAVLAASSSPTAKAALEQVKYAHQVLANAQTKARYDDGQVEPTIFATVMNRTLYLYVSKMSPTTISEFEDILTNASSTPGLDSMIIDLRGNIGGSLQDAATLLGYFIGSNQYAFDLYAQNTYNVIRTTSALDPKLSQFREVAILTDDMTQSTAEVLTASLKRFHIAYSVGGTTRGWGTVENTFPLVTTTDASTTYALLLVHAITLRNDQEPIQGRGVDPDVNIADPNWKSELATYFHSPSLIAALQKEADKAPLQ